MTRPATEGAKRSTTSVAGWSAMMSHARRSCATTSASGASNVFGETARSRIRSTLNVRIARRSSSNPIRYSACVWSDGSSRYGRTVACRGSRPSP